MCIDGRDQPWPKALYRAESIAETVTPSVGARDCTNACGLVLQIAGNVGESGSAFSRSRAGVEGTRSEVSGTQQELYCVFRRVPIVRACPVLSR